MSSRFTDDWLLPIVQTLAPALDLEKLQAEGKEPISLWAAATGRGGVSEEQLVTEAASRFRLSVAPFAPPDPSLRETLPEQLARRFHLVPIRQTDSTLEVAASNPFDLEAEQMLAFATGRQVRFALATPGQVRAMQDALYQPESTMAKLLDSFADATPAQFVEQVDEEEKASEAEASEAPIVRLVDSILADGVKNRASDLHIEPTEGDVAVRYRIDGVLRLMMKLPRKVGLPLISRIKIVSGLDIADRRRPQDGRARVIVDGNQVDLRVSTLPTSTGEKVVIRVLNQKATLLSLEAIGLFPDELATIRELLSNKEGVVLVTGPTGSGKTTTLYSSLRAIQGEGVNIITVEDPVEYRLGENVVQVQVHEKAGLTFAAALRSILRQDPDVVLVGEIRDRETASIAVQASLTGHLVLSTLHTNDAPSTVTRLTDMGIEPFKLGPALRGIIAQRLMRRVCPHCRVPSTRDEIPEKLRPVVPEGVEVWKAVGCKDCADTGYRGRFSVVEILAANAEVERLITAGAPVAQIAAAGRANGMRTIFECGLRHVLRGDTTLEELLRVADLPEALEQGETAAVAAAVAEPDEPVDDGILAGFELTDDVLSVVPGGPRVAARRGGVLLVEDEEGLRRVMKDILVREGYVVIEAGDGIAALDQVDRANPDVIILDLNLPGLDGYGVLRQLRSRHASARIPVIVLTARGDEDSEVKVFEAGADDFLTKPFRARALSARLQSVLSRRRR